MANNLNRLDGFQVLKSVYAPSTNSLRVTVVEGSTGDGSGFEVIISHTDDSIRLGNGTTFFTSTTVSSKTGLDIAVINEIDIEDLDAIKDNVAISDGNYTLGINPDKSINVKIVNQSSNLYLYNEITSVPSLLETTILSHTVVSTAKYLQKIFVSGQNIAEYRVKINGTTVDLSRTYFGGSLNSEMIFDGYLNTGRLLSVGDTVVVTVQHERPSSGNFNAKLNLVEVA